MENIPGLGKRPPKGGYHRVLSLHHRRCRMIMVVPCCRRHVVVPVASR